MGILNVTPDSFSDGGLFRESSQAVERALEMVEEGADVIDVGGESTRPGAMPVPVEEEMARVLPVVEQLTQRGLTVSVDTSRVEVARASLERGAVMINDVRALRGPGMIEVCQEFECSVCLMHMQNDPQTMQHNPSYADVVSEVNSYLHERAGACLSSGIHPRAIWVDPGFGFGKTDAQNLALIQNLSAFSAHGFPILIGVSRKGSIGRMLGGREVKERLSGSLAIQAVAQWRGAKMIRTHDVRASADFAQILSRFN